MYHGFQEQPEAFQDVLFKQTGLDTDVEHTLVSTPFRTNVHSLVVLERLSDIICRSQTLSNNDAGWFFDVDYFIVQNEAKDETQEYVAPCSPGSALSASKPHGNRLAMQTVIVDTTDQDFYKYAQPWKLDYTGSEYHNKTGA